MVPLAHGSDSAGSIRMPASCCGVFGLKPTRARNPVGPDFGEAWRGLFCDHVLTRSVRDSAAMLDATAGPDVGALYYAMPHALPFLSEIGVDPGKLRIAFTSKPFLGSTVDKDCVKGLETTAKLCQDLGHEVIEAAPQVDGRAFIRAFTVMLCVETRATIEEGEVLLNRKASPEDFETGTWTLALLGKQFLAPDFSRSLNLLQRMARQIGWFLQKYDVLLTPTLAKPPIPIGSLQPKERQLAGMEKLLGKLNTGELIDSRDELEILSEHTYEFMPYTPLFNVTGQPAMSVPLYWNRDGLPIGMQFVGRYGDEVTLFRLAGQLEEAKPWSDHIPSICAKTNL